MIPVEDKKKETGKIQRKKFDQKGQTTVDDFNILKKLGKFPVIEYPMLKIILFVKVLELIRVFTM